jgi:acyl-CoA thioester hydrolase
MTDAMEGIEVWRGAVAASDCDASGRVDARFLLGRAMEGLAGLAAELGMADAFATSANATLAVREHHIRVLSEARAGAPLAMTAGVLSLGEDEAEVLQVLRHGRTGEPCASFLTRVAHVSVRESRVFAWSARTRAAAAPLSVHAPTFARPDGLSGDPAQPTASQERAEALGLPVTGRGVVQPHECDVFGRLRPDAVMGRCAEAAAQLIDFAPRTPKSGRAGPALTEARILYLRVAAAGARVELRSAAAASPGGLQRVTHWLLDPAGGGAWASARVLGAFDLDAARAAPAQLAEAMDL